MPPKAVSSKQIRQAVEEYQLEVDGIKFWTPYFINAQVNDKEKRANADAPFLGKGSPTQIKAALMEALDRHKPQLQTGDDYRRFMAQNLIGVDCSGFAYNVLNQLLDGKINDHLFWSREELLTAFERGIPWHQSDLQQETVENYPDSVPLSKLAKDWGWKEPPRLVRAERFWQPPVSTRLRSIAQLRPGDLITMVDINSIGHLVIVTEVTAEKITYVHSSRNNGEIGGVHYGVINIKDANGSIDEQEWEEAEFFRTHEDYDLRRLRSFNNPQGAVLG